jgi:hypothetical protein
MGIAAQREAQTPNGASGIGRTFTRRSLKLQDWQHEGEYRITLQSHTVDLSIPSERKLKYRFGDLQGDLWHEDDDRG